MVQILFLFLFLCFSSSNHELNAAQTQSTAAQAQDQSTSDLSTILGTLALNGHAPIVIEKPLFDSLKDNELKRAANGFAIYKIFESELSDVSFKELRNKLEEDARRIEKSRSLLVQYKQKKGYESPKVGSGYEQVKTLFKQLDNERADRCIEAANLEHDIQNFKRKKEKLSNHEARLLHEVRLSHKAHEARLLKEARLLLDYMQWQRLSLPYNFKLVELLKAHEKDVNPYHVSAFAHMLLLDAQYNEMQTGLLNHF